MTRMTTYVRTIYELDLRIRLGEDRIATMSVHKAYVQVICHIIRFHKVLITDRTC